MRGRCVVHSAVKETVKGGDKVGRALADIARQLNKAGSLEVGYFAGATYPDGTEVAEVAEIHEYGAPKANIPARPFMRPTVTKNAKEWPKALALALKANNNDAEKALALMGEVIVGEVKQSIIDVKSPKLKEATVKAKGGRTKPLIDTSHMLDSTTYRVIKK